MSVAKKPAKRMKRPASGMPETKWRGRRKIYPIMPGPLEWVTDGNEELQNPEDPEEYLLGPEGSGTWTPSFKANVKESLADTGISHLGPTSIWDYLPEPLDNWYRRHKIVSILAMRVIHGQFWVHELQRMEMKQNLPMMNPPAETIELSDRHQDQWT